MNVISRFIALGGLCALGLAQNLNAAPPAIPRYALKVGQLLNYHQDTNVESANYRLKKSVDWRVWVTKQNDDGGWRLVIAQDVSSQFAAGKEEFRPADKNSLLGQCDLASDGRVTSPDGLGIVDQMSVTPFQFLVRLPDNEAALAKGWEATNAIDEIRSSYRLAPAAVGEPPNVLVIDVTRTAPTDAVYGRSSVSHVKFDREQGAVNSVAIESLQQDAKPQSSELTLKSVETIDAAALDKLSRSASVYFQAVAACDKAESLVARETDAEAITKHFADARQTLEKSLDGIHEPMIGNMVKEKSASLDSSKQEAIEGAANLVKLRAEPAVDWTTTDLDDKPVAPTDLRGKVVVLDFWYRGCGWCIRAMPQMKELAAEFKDQPVAILGMNKDSDVSDAKFVIEKMGLNYPSWKASEIAAKYGVQGYPTLIILGPDGKTRFQHIGFTPTLAKEVGDDIRAVLAEKKATTAKN